MGKSRMKSGKAARSSTSMARLKRVETKLEKKKKELLEIKALHKKIAGEFIDLWVETRRLKRQTVK